MDSNKFKLPEGGQAIFLTLFLQSALQFRRLFLLWPIQVRIKKMRERASESGRVIPGQS